MYQWWQYAWVGDAGGWLSSSVLGWRNRTDPSTQQLRPTRSIGRQHPHANHHTDGARAGGSVDEQHGEDQHHGLSRMILKCQTLSIFSKSKTPPAVTGTKLLRQDWAVIWFYRPSGRTAAGPCGGSLWDGACVRVGAAEHWRNRCSACSAVAESLRNGGVLRADSHCPGSKRIKTNQPTKLSLLFLFFIFILKKQLSAHA